MSTERLLATVLSSVFFLALASTCVAVPEEGTHAAPTPPREPPHDPHADKAGSGESWEATAGDADHDHDHHLDHSLDHHLAKRFIWTLTQEPYFYEKYGGGEGGEVGRVGGQLGMGRVDAGPPMNPEMLLPQALPLRNPTSSSSSSSSSLHKRLYPRFYQAYVSKHPSFNRVASPVGEHKRFPPFHPLARFRGLSPGGSSPAYRHDYAFADHPGHRLPTAPNAQPSLKYESPLLEDEEEEEEEGEEEKPVRVGELLHLLKSIAGDRGLSGHTKSFRFGISRRK